MRLTGIIPFALAAILFAAHAAWAQSAFIDPNHPADAPRTNVPPPHLWRFSATTQETDGKLRKLHGHAEIEGNTMLFRADDIEYNEATGDLVATGNVFYQNFSKKEKLWADHLEYNTDSETGKFYKVHGETSPRIDARPGILTTSNPFYFEGEWAERIGEKYIVHDGYVTNCKIPSPWWTLRGPKFDIIPGQRAIAYRSIFRLHGLPIFYTPFFYKSLEREPRKSGFLLPNIGHNSLRGMLVGIGYFWAINRSYDLTYRLQEYTSRGEAHHFDFRGKPRPGTDYDLIVYDVQDRIGEKQPYGPPLKYSGTSLYGIGKSDLGDGWNLRVEVNYISSLRFRLDWTESFNEAFGSELPTVALLNKNWQNFTFNVVGERLQNFQSAEIGITNPVTLATHYQTNAITLRKQPEAQLDGRERQLWKGAPVWFSFESSAGLLYRDQPYFDPSGVIVDRFQTGEFMDRVNFAPHVMTALHFFDFHIVPRVGVQETYYSQTQAFNPALSQQLNTPVARVIGTNLLRSSRDVSVDLIFPTLARVFQKKTRFGDKLKHVIEPRITYNYVTGVGPDFARYIHFDSTDLTSNTNDLELSLTNRIYSKRGDSVSEIFSWQLWQARYFDPTFGGALVPGQRNVVLSSAELTPYSFLFEPRSSSPVVSILRTNPFLGLGFEWRSDYDHRRGEIVNNTLSVDYRWKRYFVSLGDSLVRADPVLHAPANQLRFRGGFGDANRRGWSAGIDGVYDFDQGAEYNKHVLLYTTAQVTYNTNCCGFSVQWHRFNYFGRNDNQFRVSFAISNISTFGTLRRQDRLF